MLRLKAGVYRTNRTMQIGSMRLMGARNLTVLSAFSASYRKIHDLLVANIFKKDLVAPRADVIDISATFHDSAHK